MFDMITTAKKNLEASGEDDGGVLVAVVGEGGQTGVSGDRLEATRNHYHSNIPVDYHIDDHHYQVNLPGGRSVDQLDQAVHHCRRVATAHLGEREGSLVVWEVHRLQHHLDHHHHSRIL